MSETNFSSPYYTLHEASDLLKIPVEILIRQFEVGALKVRKRVTVITLDKDNVEMTFEVYGFRWLDIESVRASIRRDIPGMEGLGDETAIRIDRVLYRECDLQDLAAIESASGDGYIVLHEDLPARDKDPIKEDGNTLRPRAESTYLNIIGAMLSLMLGKTPSGKPQSVFSDQASIIDALLANFGEKPGIAKRTLEEKLALAKRTLGAS